MIWTKPLAMALGASVTPLRNSAAKTRIMTGIRALSILEHDTFENVGYVFTSIC